MIRLFLKRVYKYSATYTVFSAFLGLNYILPYLMGSEVETHRYNALTVIRLLGVFMFILLLLKNYWPIRMRKYLTPYWYMTILYALPFSTTFSYLIMGGTKEGLVSIPLAIMMLSAIVTRRDFIILAMSGTALGIVCYHLCALGHVKLISIDLLARQHLAYTCVFSVLAGSFFIKRVAADRRLQTLELLGEIIGTEIENVVAMNKAHVNNIQFSSDQLHVERRLPSEDHQEFYLIKVDKQVYLSFKEAVDNLVRDNEKGAQTLHRTLANLRQEVDMNDFTTLSVRQCINDALALYALTQDQKNSLFINLDEDFKFYGSAYYMQHMLFNLLDNTFKHSKKNCTIEVWIDSHKLYIRDNGSGISKEALPYIFDPFFTTAQGAMGIGLTFCKLVMRAFGGTVICKSKQGTKSFAEFILTFPQM